MTTPFQDDLQLALRLADAADAVSLARFGASDLAISTKADSTHVSDADLATEQAIRSIIAQERPQDGVFGEEFGSSGSSDRQWVIDPIDGTAHFLRGVPLWGTLIALLINGVPVVGVVSMPALQRRWWAATGAGAWTNNSEQPLAVSGIKNIGESAVCFQSISQWQGAGKLDALHRLTQAAWRDRGYGDVFAYMMLAEGRLELVAEFDIALYDIAATVPIILEAGGRFTSFEGDDQLTTGSAVATNGHLHQEFLEILHGR